MKNNSLQVLAQGFSVASRSAYSTVRYRGGGSSYGGAGGYYVARRSLPLNTIIKFVPQQQAWVVERFGKFHRILEPGLALLLPFIDQIRYVKTLKEVAVEIPTQSAITQDNVTITIDGVLYYRIFEPYKASYGIEDADFSISQLAQTTMRSEIGQMSLDKTLAERAQLNHNITRAINEAAAAWGIECLRYEIRDIHPPDSVVKAMHSQVSAERQKRALILESEGQRQSAINVAEGHKQAQILASEAKKMEQINLAAGDAEAILLKAKATATGVERVAAALEEKSRGSQAVSVFLAEKYIDAFSHLAKTSTTLLLPSGSTSGSSSGPSLTSDPASFVAQAMSIYNVINKQQAAALAKDPPMKSLE